MSPPSAHVHAARTLHRRYWQRSILIPLWTQQLLLQVCSVIIFWFAVTIYWSGGPKHGPPKGSNAREQAILASFFVLYLALLLATLGEILLYCANTLQPKGYLASQLLKTVASAGVWATLGVYPYAIRDPVGNRTQVTVGLEVLFLWVQCVLSLHLNSTNVARIPMLSSLVHALLVWREERAIRREEAALAEAPRPTHPNFPPVQTAQASEQTPLLANRALGGRRRAGSVV
jgi:hypothetical protein